MEGKASTDHARVTDGSKISDLISVLDFFLLSGKSREFLIKIAFIYVMAQLIDFFDYFELYIKYVFP